MDRGLKAGSLHAPSPGRTRPKWPANVFTVGTYNGTTAPSTQSFSAIQPAVDAAEHYAATHPPTGGHPPTTYVLVAPGDYKTTSLDTPPAGAPPAGVLITEPDLWLVGMGPNGRNSVIVDGTQSGPPCSTATSDQNFGPGGSGMNGIMVWKAADVWVENMTVCNFLAGNSTAGATGNEIWWNGGANSAQVLGGPGYWGEYLTATSTYFHDETTAAQYGIFSSNWNGGTWDHSYASNFNDSGYYIGACQDVCNQTVDDAWAEYNALGYSGSNSGGRLLVENSQFDNNQDGFDTNTQNGDNPPPQDGACPPGVTPPVTGVATCWVFIGNKVHDNNNPNVPTAGSAGAGPVGTGMSLSGARNDTVIDNNFYNNDAWGTILVPYPDSGGPCTGGTQLQVACIFDESGIAVLDNTYANNGSFGNPTNGDIGATNLEPGPTDCFSGNMDKGGLTTSPPLIQLLYPSCTGLTVPPDANALFTDEVACDSDSISIGPIQGGTVCLPGSKYPRQAQVIMHPLPGTTAGTYGGAAVPALENPESASLLTSMPNPCRWLPNSPWCPATT